MIAGIDEAGRGPWAGPVVAAAVVLQRHPLPVRIDDSKRLTPRQRAHAYSIILQYAEIGVGIVCAGEIDRHNILQATFRAMHEAVRGLPALPDLALVDGHLLPPLPVPCRAIIGGDASVYEISCASIVAKVIRDRLMEFYDGLYPGFGFCRHKGYGTALHSERLRALGPCLLHRKTFQPIAEALSAAALRRSLSTR